MSKIPRLFAWGDDGIPGEFKIYLKSISGEDGLSQVDFMREGVVQLAQEYYALLEKEKEAFAERDPAGRLYASPKISHQIRGIVYLLHAYCAQCNAPAPAELLRLTFEVLDLQEKSPPIEIVELLHDKISNVIPVGTEKLSAFITASALDGEADARGEELNASQMARAVGVQRGTIRDWRQMEEYKSRRRWAALVWSANLAASPKAERSDAWKRATEPPAKGGNHKV